MIYSMKIFKNVNGLQKMNLRKNGKLNQPKGIIPELTFEYWFERILGSQSH